MVNVPKMEELAAKRLLLQAIEDPAIKDYLPDVQVGRSVNQKFLYNVSCSIDSVLDHEHSQA